MKKLLFAAVLLTAMSIGKVSAQFLMFWDGDKRFGVSAGISMPIESMPTFVCKSNWGSPALKMVDGSLHHSMVVPSFKLYTGMEKDLDGNFAFGFQGWIGLTKNKWNVDFENPDTKDVTTFTVASSTLDVNEGVYLAYYVTDGLSVTFGAGISEYMDFRGSTSSVTRNAAGIQTGSVDNIESTGSPFDMGMGYMLNAGATYNLTDAFYVGGNLLYQKSFFGSGTFSEGETFFMNSLGQGVYYSSSPLNSIQLLATIGLRW